MKQCSKCKEVKGLDCFNKHKRNNDGLRYKCKECENVYNSAYYNNNKEMIRERSAIWRKENEDKIKQWRIDNKDDLSKRHKEWVRKNPEKSKAIQARYIKKDPEHVKSLYKKGGKKRVIEMGDKYIMGQLKSQNLPITPETIEVKREQIKINRLIKSKTK